MKKLTKLKHPVQPLGEDGTGTIRFKENPIVTYLLQSGDTDMNKLALMPFSNEDRQQFAQLIGYSLGGYRELSYVTDAAYETAARQIIETTTTQTKYEDPATVHGSGSCQ